MGKRQRTVGLTLLFAPMCSAFQSRAAISFKTTTAISRQDGRKTATPGAVALAAAAAAADSGEDDVNGGGGLVTQSDARSQLFSAFANLDLSDQYDAVLCSACAKILDAGDLSEEEATVKLQDCTQLLQEMNDSKVAASPRSLMALVDSTVKTQNAQVMAAVMSQCLRNVNGITQYGARQTDVRWFPSSPTSRVRCPDGQLRTARERLDRVAAVPTDDRASEVAAALLFAGTVVACEATNLLPGWTDARPAANLMLALLIGVLVVDNFYDILKNASQFFANQIGTATKDDDGTTQNNNNPKFNLPDALPAGLGSGAATGRVVRGLTRLLAVDAEREAACEAAALYAAYVLGLPCYPFRPNAREGSVLVAESVNNENNDDSEEGDAAASSLDSLFTASGILRMLVWLMAPVAMESASHAQLLMSDPREAAGFLTRLEEQFGDDDDERLFWTSSSSDKDDLLQWAYTEADCLLRDNKAAVQEIANRLSGKAATVGDCVAVIENW